MSLPVELSDEALAEYDEAIDYYAAQSAGRGVEFVTNVRQVFRRISAHPLRYGVVVAEVRKALVAGFPYAVFYRPFDTHVEVIAVFHGSRDPAIWRGRV